MVALKESNDQMTDVPFWTLPVRKLLAEWRAIEDFVLEMEPSVLRDQFLDVLKTNYADALDEASASDGQEDDDE